jgi:hypothetical protein
VVEPAIFTPDLLPTYYSNLFLPGSYIRNINVAGVVSSVVPLDLTSTDPVYAPYGIGTYQIMSLRERGMLWYFFPYFDPTVPSLVFATINPGTPPIQPPL